ncbi:MULTISPECIES: hypothetical protein [Rhizobium/Agrobacterium group]|uniref:Uncharacterized protein n=1 Tax=Agrobacterium vitis TaxID=373 RepID=A0ABD6H8M5_AGRVI|nr:MULTISPECIES: hypothetical protein [Rhizobium/Agrobacterium group]MUO29456.1 hypothetical protein [Agrobacterium vitis]MUO42631.1 hypothetical protein [Agrobacterium vitis]MUP10600.1 hypothetical protein [Agrobacterium vitis]
MTLDDIHSNLADQDRGRWLEVRDPWQEKPVGLRLLIAGPDGDVQRKARVEMMDRLSDAADLDGKVSFEEREKARVYCLARCVLSWDVAASFGLDATFGQVAIIKLLRIAWLQQQVDAFAGDRGNFPISFNSEVA